MRKKFLFGVAAFAAGLSPAFAADMPARPPIVTKEPPPVMALFDWSGFYVGALAGYGWGDSRHRDSGLLASGSLDADGWLLGGTLGYNWQAGQTVLGLEGDLAWTDIGGKGTSSLGVPISTRLSWLGTGRVRAGYAVDNYLFYVTGGVAYGKVRAAAAGFGADSNNHVGWTVGGGVEAMVSSNWSAKLEYLYVDLGRERVYTAGGPTQADFKSHLVRAGLNYRF